MKFSGFPKFAALSALLGALILTLAGCGATVSNLALTQGNWAVTATSTAPGINIAGPTFVLGGNLTQSGATLSGTLAINQSGCISPQTLQFTGTVKDKNITLVSNAFDGNVISVTASGTKDSLSGNYTITGGCADQGTVTAGAVPSISGTWNGTLSPVTLHTNGIAQVGISAALTQSASASEDGSFALTGTLTYTGTSCSEPANLVGSSISGSTVTINTDSAFSYVAPTLNSLTNPTSMTGDYDGTSDVCSGVGSQTLVLTKQ